MKKLLKKWFSQDYIVNTVGVICVVSIIIFSIFSIVYIILNCNSNEPAYKYRLYDSTLEVTDIVVLKSKESGVLYCLGDDMIITPIYDSKGELVVR